MMSAKLIVPAGAPVHANGGFGPVGPPTISLVQRYFAGNICPLCAALLVSVNAPPAPTPAAPPVPAVAPAPAAPPLAPLAPAPAAAPLAPAAAIPAAPLPAAGEPAVPAPAAPRPAAAPVPAAP